MKLVIPKRIKKDDVVATVSLSWGGAGDANLLWRYEVGKKRIEELFEVKVIEAKHTLAGSEYIYNNPKKRAEDLMEVFKDPEVKAIFSTIGGDDSIRLLPYIDFEIIKNNPKIFIGYSDTTVNHFMCLHAGVQSYYGPSVLAEFAENHDMFGYTKESLLKVIRDGVVGDVLPPIEWTSEHVDWSYENRFIRKQMQHHEGYEVLMGKGVVRGHLVGGCIDVMEMIKDTIIWPSKEIFEGAILFFETSEEMPPPQMLLYWLRNYGASNILSSVNGLIFGKPYHNKYYDEYKNVILKVMKEFDLK